MTKAVWNGAVIAASAAYYDVVVDGEVTPGEHRGLLSRIAGRHP